MRDSQRRSNGNGSLGRICVQIFEELQRIAKSASENAKMIETVQKWKLLTRAQATINIILTVLLVFYICHSVTMKYLDKSEPDHCWFSWISIYLLSFVFFTLQFTIDLILFVQNSSNIQSLLRKLDYWTRFSILLIFLLIFALLFSLVCPNPSSWAADPIIFFFIISITLIFRILGIFVVKHYKCRLVASVLEIDRGSTSMIRGSSGTNSPISFFDINVNTMQTTL